MFAQGFVIGMWHRVLSATWTGRFLNLLPMAGLISPKPLSYMHQMQYNPYSRGVAGYNDSSANGLPPLTHSTQQSMVPGFNGPSPGIMGVHEETKIYGLVIELLDANTRETALLELSKKREQYDDLALVLWHSFGALFLADGS